MHPNTVILTDEALGVTIAMTWLQKFWKNAIDYNREVDRILTGREEAARPAAHEPRAEAITDAMVDRGLRAKFGDSCVESLDPESRAEKEHEMRKILEAALALEGRE